MLTDYSWAWDLPWSVVDKPDVTPLTKTVFLHLSSYLLAITPCSVVSRSHVPSLALISSPQLLHRSLSLEGKVWQRHPTEGWASQSLLCSICWPLVGFCVNCHILQENVSPKQDESFPTLWVWWRVIGVILLLFSFSRVILVGFLLGPMTYLTSSFWSHWQCRI